MVSTVKILKRKGKTNKKTLNGSIEGAYGGFYEVNGFPLEIEMSLQVIFPRVGENYR
jgi:hypothetical protein